MSTISGLGGGIGYPLKSSRTTADLLISKVMAGDIGQSAQLAPSAEASTTSAAEEFKKYMAMSPAEKLRYSLLEEMGITEEQLAAMPADERAQIEKKIEALIKERLGLQASDDVDAGQEARAANNNPLLKLFQIADERRPSVDTFS
jgi:hypothetical protein